MVGPDREAWSFQHLDARVDAAAAWLREQSIQAGEHVGLLAPNGPGFVVAVHALMRVGAVQVPLNTRLTASELEWQCEDAGLRTVLDAAGLDQLLSAPDAAAVERDFDLDAVHSIIYTSGTTGRPRAPS